MDAENSLKSPVPEFKVPTSASRNAHSIERSFKLKRGRLLPAGAEEESLAKRALVAATPGASSTGAGPSPGSVGGAPRLRPGASLSPFVTTTACADDAPGSTAPGSCGGGPSSLRAFHLVQHGGSAGISPFAAFAEALTPLQSGGHSASASAGGLSSRLPLSSVSLRMPGPPLHSPVGPRPSRLSMGAGGSAAGAASAASALHCGASPFGADGSAELASALGGGLPRGLPLSVGPSGRPVVGGGRGAADADATGGADAAAAADGADLGGVVRRLQLPGSRAAPSSGRPAPDSSTIQRIADSLDDGANDSPLWDQMIAGVCVYDDVAGGGAGVAAGPRATPAPTGPVKPSKSRGGRPKRCNCKNSKCLKLYCDCFSVGLLCDGCNCVDCKNDTEHSAERDAARQQVLKRNPRAFNAKFVKGEDENEAQPPAGAEVAAPPTKHARGCHCSKSRCIKNYCECWQMGIKCNPKCKCLNCANREADDPTAPTDEPAVPAALTFGLTDVALNDAFGLHGGARSGSASPDDFALSALMCSEELVPGALPAGLTGALPAGSPAGLPAGSPAGLPAGGPMPPLGETLAPHGGSPTSLHLPLTSSSDEGGSQGDALPPSSATGVGGPRGLGRLSPIVAPKLEAAAKGLEATTAAPTLPKLLEAAVASSDSPGLTGAPPALCDLLEMQPRLA